MTKLLIALPCTARELENALHASCDHDGLWDASISTAYRYDGAGKLRQSIEIETETKGETK